MTDDNGIRPSLSLFNRFGVIGRRFASNYVQIAATRTTAGNDRSDVTLAEPVQIGYFPNKAVHAYIHVTYAAILAFPTGADADAYVVRTSLEVNGKQVELIRLASWFLSSQINNPDLIVNIPIGTNSPIPLFTLVQTVDDLQLGSATNVVFRTAINYDILYAGVES